MRMEANGMTATELIEEFLKEAPDLTELVARMRKRGVTDEDIKDFLEGL